MGARVPVRTRARVMPPFSLLVTFFIVNENKRTSFMLAKDDYSANLRGKLHKDTPEEMPLELSQHLFISNDVKGGFDEERKISDGIYGMNMLKKTMREENWTDQQKPWEEEKNPLKNRI